MTEPHIDPYSELRSRKQGCAYLALILLVPHPEFDIRVAEAVGIHGLEAATFYQTDADYTSPQLGFSVHI